MDIMSDRFFNDEDLKSILSEMLPADRVEEAFEALTEWADFESLYMNKVRKASNYELVFSSFVHLDSLVIYHEPIQGREFVLYDHQERRKASVYY